MATATVQRPEREISERSQIFPASFTDEIVALCPKCKTMETMAFANGHLLENRKFFQIDQDVFHDCGSAKPCHFYRLGDKLAMVE